MVGTPGQTPFVGSVQDATEARKLLNKQLAPRGDRRAVLDFDAEANALALPQFSDADKVGDSGVKIEGEIGRKFGVDWFADDGVVTHIAGSAADDRAMQSPSPPMPRQVPQVSSWPRIRALRHLSRVTS